jgi:CRP/FNR family transcriptional regulator, cyclic AMP receptor protein
LELLSRVPLFGQCNKAELREIARLGTEAEVASGIELTREGARGREFFLLLQGEVDCTVHDVNLGVLGPGDFFGELALLDGGERNATIKTRQKVRVLVLDRSEFHRLLLASPSISLKLLSSVAGRLRCGQTKAIH